MANLFLGVFLLPYLTGCGKSGKDNGNTGEQSPNIVYILADDLGYGDISYLNDSSKIQTSNIDKLAEEGMSFTDANSASAVSTPTRYGILTGRYSWRTRLKSGVLWGTDKPLIDSETMTVASLLNDQGYNTACIGKWHLGLDWVQDDSGRVDFSKPIENGPLALGFQYFYGISSSLDIPPYVYIENDRVTSTSIDTIRENEGKGFWRKGPIAENFKHKKVLPELTDKAVDYINRQSQDKPFFLYFPLPAPHTPILPTEPFQGKTNTNAYGDFVLMVDHVVGQVMDALESKGLKGNTLIVFTSDNGCSPRADFEELAEVGHDPSYRFRGHKADIYEGGHRIPFIARWPGHIEEGSTSDETICLNDLLATCADMMNDTLPDTAGEDSYSILPVLLGQEYQSPIREATVHHSVNGSFAIRQGKWKLIFCPGSGGWSDPRPEKAGEMDIPSLQLYNLEKDIDESNNVVSEHPRLVDKLTDLMDQYIEQGRSTPGTKQQNYGEIELLPEGYER
ncbi:MAG: arylsulfatase [Bacteroidales bacterium]